MAIPYVSVLGLGNWGTALANHLAVKGVDVVAWSRNTGIVESINSLHKNSKYQKDVELSKNLKATADLNYALKAEWIVLAVPSHGLLELLETAGTALLAKKIISGIKGFSESSNLTTLKTLESFYNRSRSSNGQLQACVLAGPCFASDLVTGRPASIVIAADNAELAKSAAELFTSPTLKAYTSSDSLGVELGGAVKNVIAIAAGISDGMELGESAKAGLITRGLAEMTRLGIGLGAKRDTFSGLAGLGDLAMTSTSNLSRNRIVGVRLGKGEALDQILQSLGSVAEGVRSCSFILKLAESAKVEMPITEGVYNIVEGKITPSEAVKALMKRPMKEE